MPLIAPLALAVCLFYQGVTTAEVEKCIGNLGPKPRLGTCGVGNMGLRKSSKTLQAADRLIAIGPAAVEPLLNVVGAPADWTDPKHPNVAKRVLAIEALGRIGDRRAIDPLGAVLRHHAGVQERVSAACALAELRAGDYAEDVVGLFADERVAPSAPTFSVGEYVSLMMRPYGQAAHLAVIKALKSPNHQVRLRAMRAAEELAIPSTASELAQVASTSTSTGEMRRYAVSALGKCGDAKSFEVLLPMLQSDDDVLAVTAAESLGRLRSHSLSALTKLQASPKPRIRRLSLYALCYWNYGREDLYRLVRKSMADPAPEVRWQALQILGYQSRIDDDDQERLRTLTRDTSPRVREAALNVLNLIKQKARVETNAFW